MILIGRGSLLAVAMAPHQLSPGLQWNTHLLHNHLQVQSMQAQHQNNMMDEGSVLEHC